MVLASGREILVIETTALSPSLGVEVTGLDSLDDDSVVARLLEALKWRGVLLIRGLNLDDEGQLASAVVWGSWYSRRRGRKSSLSHSIPQRRYGRISQGTFCWHIDDTTNDVPAKRPHCLRATSRWSAAGPNSPIPTPHTRTFPRMRRSATKVCGSSTASRPRSALCTPTPPTSRSPDGAGFPSTSPRSCGIAATAAGRS